MICICLLKIELTLILLTCAQGTQEIAFQRVQLKKFPGEAYPRPALEVSACDTHVRAHGAHVRLFHLVSPLKCYRKP